MWERSLGGSEDPILYPSSLRLASFAEFSWGTSIPSCSGPSLDQNSPPGFPVTHVSLTRVAHSIVSPAGLRGGDTLPGPLHGSLCRVLGGEGSPQHRLPVSHHALSCISLLGRSTFLDTQRRSQAPSCSTSLPSWLLPIQLPGRSPYLLPKS